MKSISIAFATLCLTSNAKTVCYEDLSVPATNTVGYALSSFDETNNLGNVDAKGLFTTIG